MEYTDWTGTVARRQIFTQNVECLSPSSSPLVKGVSITCNPVWWSEVVPESRCCFVWSQTGHDQTVLPWSSWRATLLCGSRVKRQGGAPVIHGRTDSEGRRGKAPLSLGWQRQGWHEKDTSIGTLASHTHLLAPLNAPTPPFSVLLISFIHSTLFHKHNTAFSVQLSDLAELKHWHESRLNSHKPSISGNRNGAECHKGHVFIPVASASAK